MSLITRGLGYSTGTGEISTIKIIKEINPIIDNSDNVKTDVDEKDTYKTDITRRTAYKTTIKTKGII